MLDDVLGRVSADPQLSQALVPLVRGYLRYFPVRAGKAFVWTRIAEPYFAWQPHSFRARTRFGFSLDGDSKDLIQQWIYYFGVWEPSLTMWIRHRLKPGDTFVDVGANIGYFALLAARTVGASGRVVAIEASPAIAERLRQNVAENHADNLRTKAAAALGSRGVVRLYRGNDANCGETTIDAQYGGEFECEVEGYPLQELLTPSELETARLIKIDAEGAEYAILSGFDGFDRLRRDAEFIVEMHPSYLAHRGESADAVLTLMANAGFTPYLLSEEYWPPAYLQGGTGRPTPRRYEGSAIDDGTVLIFSRDHAAVLD
jgi:FkbM family methyltransferase